MIYIIYGDQKYLVNRTIRKIEIDYKDIQKFNYSEDNIDDIISSLVSFSLLSDKKLVEIFEFKPLLFDDSDLKKDKRASKFLEILRNCDHIDVSLILYESNLVENEIYKLVKDSGKFIQNLSLTKNDWKLYANKKFEKAGVKITFDAIEELISRCENDLNRFEIEFNKLTSYSNDLNLSDIKLLVAEPLEENIFSMVNDLLDLKKDSCLERFRKLIYTNDAVRMISLLATNFKFYSQCYYLSVTENKSAPDIAKVLKCNSKRADISIKKIKKIGIKRINKAFENLFEIDYKIKNGYIDKNLAFELFINNF